MSKANLNDIVSLCKRRGFVFPSSEIYGGWEATYDFGPLGAEVLRNLRNLWWQDFVQKDPMVVGIDGAIISHPRVWEASGHVESFADVMVEDVKTNKRYRADHLIADALNENVDGMSPVEIDEVIQKHSLKSPDGNPLSKAKKFNNLVETYLGTLENEKELAYLRGETCQPIFYNYDLVKNTMRKDLPFGIAQIGKAFRNEIKVGPYFFRTREFEQMELEMYVRPEDAEKHFEELKVRTVAWLKDIGLNMEEFRLRDQEFKERAHYNKVATDGEYNFSFGWKEFLGIHNRGDWDLSRHGEYSGFDFSYKDEANNTSFIPNIVEFSIGLNRLMLVLLFDAFRRDDKRIWLQLDPRISPYRAAVFPLVKNKPEIVDKARQVYKSLLSNGVHVDWDDRSNIGKRYLAQDEIGTPSTITVDYQTLEDDTVTVRDRDTMEQKRIEIVSLPALL